MAKSNKPNIKSVAWTSGRNYAVQWSRKDCEDQEIKYTIKANRGDYEQLAKSVSKSKSDYTIKIPDPMRYGTSKAYVSSNQDKIYPDGQAILKKLVVYVRIKQKKHSWSDWDSYTFSFEAPKDPKFSKTDLTAQNEATFSFTKPTVNNKGTNQFSKFEVESRTKKDIAKTTDAYFKSLVWDESATAYKHAVQTKSTHSVKVTKSNPSDSVAAICRIRSLGPGGHSTPWIYKHYVFAEPKSAKDTTVTKVKDDPIKQLIEISVKWNAPANPAHPINGILAMYCIGVPSAGLQLPSDANWQQYRDPYKDIKGNDTVKYNLNVSLKRDECVWVRLDTSHSPYPPTIGSPVLAHIGKLANPVITNVDPHYDTHRVTVTATNNSQVEDSFLAIIFQSSGNSPYNGKILGVIPHNRSDVTFAIPDTEEGETITFRAIAYAAATYTVVGNPNGIQVYTINGYMESYSGSFYGPTADGYYNLPFCHISVFDSFVNKEFYTSGDVLIEEQDMDICQLAVLQGHVAFVVKMNSESNKVPSYGTVWFRSKETDSSPVDAVYMQSDEVTSDSEIETPKAPSNIVLTQLADNRGVRVEWDVSWTEANGAEVSWADHEDAWESTAQPSTFEVSNLDRPVLTIADASAGTKWYIRVRLFKKTSSGNNVYGPYGYPGEGYYPFDLASAPVKPWLELSKSTVSEIGETVASWVYVSTDTTNQQSAFLYEIGANGEETLVAQEQTAQHITLDLRYLRDNDVVTNWVNGTTHSLAVRVVSESGAESELSDTVTLTIAPRIIVNLDTSDSLTYHKNVTDPVTYTGTTITFDAGEDDNIKDISEIRAEISPVENPAEEFDILKSYVCSEDDESKKDITIEYTSTIQGLVDKALNDGVLLYNDTCVVTANRDWIIKQGENVVVKASTTLVGVEHFSENDTLELALPKTGYKSITGMTLTVNSNEYTPYWGDIVGDFYGGTVNLTSGVVTSLYSSDGTLLPEPVDYQIETTTPYLENGTNTISSEDGNLTVVIASEVDEGYELSQLPFIFTATGAGETGVTHAHIERAQTSPIYCPDDRIKNGYEDEILYQYDYPGEETQRVLGQNLLSNFDDGVMYRLVVIVADQIGQVAQVERVFKVNWSDQALVPEGSVYFYDPNSWSSAAVITPIAPTGASGTAHADIYRLTADKPELIYTGAEFGEAIVDPYPTIGQMGGYRIVYVTADGDYYTTENTPAWVDIPLNLRCKFQMIDFGSTHIDFKYNINLDNNWKKKFTQTDYLGGGIQGDWDDGTSFDSSISGNTFYDIEPEVYEQLRDLGDYLGYCHLRTIDGTNIVANIDVSDSSSYNPLEHQHDISLSITKVDNPDLDGVTLEEYESSLEE